MSVMFLSNLVNLFEVLRTAPQFLKLAFNFFLPRLVLFGLRDDAGFGSLPRTVVGSRVRRHRHDGPGETANAEPNRPSCEAPSHSLSPDAESRALALLRLAVLSAQHLV